MELKLIRACFPGSTMGQLYLNKQLLCVYIGLNEEKGWIPAAHFPDGRYSLRKPRIKNKDWDLQLTFSESRKPLLMDFKKLMQQDLKDYDEAPLYICMGNGRDQLSEQARKNMKQVVTAIETGEKVYLTISSKMVA
jgi:hypothetical protein